MNGQTIRLNGDRQRSIAHHLVEKAPDGAVLNIREASRSSDQNSLMWVLLSDISRAKPEGRMATAEVWKQLFMHACGHDVQFEIGLNGQPFPTGFRSSRLTVSQMSDLLESIYAYGAAHDVKWTEPLAQQWAA